MKKVILLVVLFILAPLTTKAFEVGVQTFTWHNGLRDIQVMVWYPTQLTGEQGFNYYGFISGQAIFNAPINTADSPYPLLIFSHGLGMCSYQSVFLTESLASQGYIVIAPDHADASICRIGGGSDLTYKQIVKAMLLGHGNFDQTVARLFPQQLTYLQNPAYRPQEISFVLTEFLNEPQFAGFIDYSRIGGLGHSFGGWTMLALAGGKIDCEDPSNYEPTICNAPETEFSSAEIQRKLCCQCPYKGNFIDLTDSRLQAVVAISPGSFIFPHYGDLNLQVPVIYMTGDHFEVDYWTNLQLPYNLTITPKYLVEFIGTDHLTPSDLMSQYFGAQLALRGYWFYPCKKKKYINYTLAFFNKYLRQDSSDLEQLLNNCHPFVNIQYQE